MSHQPRREHLLDTAYRLFNKHGYHATGIDWILKESGVSKATLYKHFPSKEALIIAVLQRRHEQLLAHLRARMLDTPEGETAVLSLFDALAEWVKQPDFHGCNFIKASSEYLSESDEIYQLAAEHKARFREVLVEFLPAELLEREQIAEQISILVDGAIIQAHMRHDIQVISLAKSTAQIIFANAIAGA